MMTRMLVIGCMVAAAVSGAGILLAEEPDLKPREAAMLGRATAQRIDDGQTGDDLEKGVREDLQAIREGRKQPDEEKPDEGKPAEGNGPGEALEHGLAEKDAENFGRFVNTQLAKGLRGKDLAAEIHRELGVRREARRAEDKRRGEDARGREGDTPRGKGPPEGRGSEGRGPGPGRDKPRDPGPKGPK